MGEKVFTDFEQSLALGHYNETVIAHEFGYQGVPLKRTVGKNDIDFYLPDGRKLEWKMDIRSQCTGAGAIEWPTLQRRADLYGYTFTYARIYTHQQLEFMYLHQGKKPAEGFGDANYDGRYVRGMGKEGMPLWQFIKELRQP